MPTACTTGVGAATGARILYNPVTPDEFQRALEQAGLPPAIVAMSVALGDAVRAGEFDLGDPALERLLGRPPITLKDFLGMTLTQAEKQATA